ncbi:uncharacterized protein LOC141577079 isoform X1 [Camelus bactrianus]|uniref:Uncharacterized protein LOC141577079 isoform X1 n=1 Tax=Camelus bactrianus TaxID=9837 RepID=A0AC58Q386_CAMBA
MPPPPQGPVQMAVGPGLLCKAGSPKAGQQRNNKMDSLLLKTRKLATSHGCQSLQPIEGRQHQGIAGRLGTTGPGDRETTNGLSSTTAWYLDFLRGTSGFSVNVPASNMEAAAPFMAWLWKSQSITSAVVTSPSIFTEGDKDIPQWKKCQKKFVAMFVYYTLEWGDMCLGQAWVCSSGGECIESHCSFFTLCARHSLFIFEKVHLPLFCQGFSCLMSSVSCYMGHSVGWDLGGFQTIAVVPYPTHSVPDLTLPKA